MADQLVLRHSGSGRLSHFQQSAAFQKADGGLDGGFRQSCILGQLLETERCLPLLQPEQCGPDREVNQEGARRTVMASQVRHENIENVFVDGYMVHITIVIRDIDPLQFFR